jgi:ubiquinone/menaquinone biosynthesis C-methylase UbiE
MKSITNVYDEISAVRYDDDRFGIYAGARKIAMDQLKGSSTQLSRIADLAVGTGEFLKQFIGSNPGVEAFGVDISVNMLDRARSKVPATFLQGSAEDADRLLPNGSLDLALLHFVFSYIDPLRTLAAANAILRTGGLLSVITSTNRMFAGLKKLAAGFLGEELTPEGIRELPAPGEVTSQAAKLGFTVERTEIFRRLIEFRSLDELWDVGLHEGWFAPYFALLSPEQTAAIRDREAMFFPVTDEVEVEIVLLRKSRT